jgi:hypothetical protein
LHLSKKILENYYICILLVKLEIHKKIRKSVKRVGVQRFFTGLIFLFAGLIWKFFQATGDASSGLTLQKILSFWPIFWALWMGSGFLWWVLSGFKSVNGLIFSFAGGAFMAETVMPGVVINTDNGPYFVILIGLFLFALPRKNYQTTAYSYGKSTGAKSHSHKHSQTRTHSASLSEQEKINHQSKDAN